MGGKPQISVMINIRVFVVLLQEYWSNCWCQWSTTTEAASDPECCCSSRHRNQKIGAYDTHSMRSSFFTGYQFDSASRSRSQFWSTNVSTAWPYSTFRCTVSRRQHSPPGIFYLLTLLDWLFHIWEQTAATVASLFKDLGCGTVFLLNCEQQTFRWTCSETNWRHFFAICSCSHGTFAALCDLVIYKCT